MWKGLHIVHCTINQPSSLEGKHVNFLLLWCSSFQVALQGFKKAQTILVKSSPHVKNPRTQALNQEIFLTAELLILTARIGRALIANPTK